MISTRKRSAIEWREVPGFPGYRVGRDGSVWSCWKHGCKPVMLPNRWRRLKCGLSADGYVRVTLRKPGGRGVRRFVHALVLEAFVGPCPKGMECLHGDGNRKNNRRENLRWGTRQENMLDAIRHGTTTRGERNPMAKLTAFDVSEIRHQLDTGRLRNEIAAEFGVHCQTVSAIKRRKLWRHLG